MEKMGRRNIGAIQNRDNIPPDDVKRALEFSMRVAEINTGRVQSPEELAERFERLFEIAGELGRLPRYEHLMLASGLPRSTFFDYGNENSPYTPGKLYSDIIKRAKSLIASAESELAMTGKVPAPVYIFRSKNYEGLKDVQEIKAVSEYNTEPEDANEIVAALPEVNEDDFVEIKSN